MGFAGGAGGGTDSDQSRSSGAVDIQTLNGMQESGVQQHFAMHQQRPEVIDSAPRAQPAPRVRARAARQQPSPFGLNPILCRGRRANPATARAPGSAARAAATAGSWARRPLTSNLPDRYRGKPGAMENVTQAVNDELMQSLDYKLATSNVNYVQSRRDVHSFPSSLSTFTPTTSRVARIPLTSGMDFIDPESVKIAFRVRNNDATSDLFPTPSSPAASSRASSSIPTASARMTSPNMGGSASSTPC